MGLGWGMKDNPCKGGSLTWKKVKHLLSSDGESVRLQQLDEILDEEGNVMLIARDVDGHNTAYINGRSFDVQIDRQASNPPYQFKAQCQGSLKFACCCSAMGKCTACGASTPTPTTCPLSMSSRKSLSFKMKHQITCKA